MRSVSRVQVLGVGSTAALALALNCKGLSAHPELLQWGKGPAY